MVLVKQKKNNQGMVAIITLLGISAFALAIISTLAVLAIDELKMANTGGAIDPTFYAAEAGLNEGLYRLIETPVPGTIYFLNIDGIPVETLIEGSGHERTITSTATNSNGKVRTLQISANVSSIAGGFDSAIHGGAGGVILENNSKIIGSVYSNGGIFPDSPGSKGNIEGRATVALDFPFKNVTIAGEGGGDSEVWAHIIIDSNITGDAFYSNAADSHAEHIDSDTKVNGTACPNPGCHPGERPDAPIKPLPFGDDEIALIKEIIDDAVAADPSLELSPNPADCPPSVEPGFYCIHYTDVSLPLAKINGNLYLGNNKTLTLDGQKLWVTGDIILENNGTIKINPDNDSLKSEMITIIAEGVISMSPNYKIVPFTTITDVCDDDGNSSIDPEVEDTACEPADINACGGNPSLCIQGPLVDDKSFILMASIAGDSDPAGRPDIRAANNSRSIVFSAHLGTLKVKQNGKLTAGAAETLYLENGATVTYNKNLASFVIGGGGGEEVGTALGSWREK